MEKMISWVHEEQTKLIQAVEHIELLQRDENWPTLQSPLKSMILIALYRALHINQDIGILYSEYKKQMIRTLIIGKTI